MSFLTAYSLTAHFIGETSSSSRPHSPRRTFLLGTDGRATMTTETALCAPIRRSRPAETPRPRRGEAVGGTVAATMHCGGRPGSCFPSKQILAEGETFAEQDKTHKGGGGIASSLRGQPHSPRRGEESRRRPHRARSRIYTNTLCVEITG